MRVAASTRRHGAGRPVLDPLFSQGGVRKRATGVPIRAIDDGRCRGMPDFRQKPMRNQSLGPDRDEAAKKVSIGASRANADASLGRGRVKPGSLPRQKSFKRAEEVVAAASTRPAPSPDVRRSYHDAACGRDVVIDQWRKSSGEGLGRRSSVISFLPCR